MGMELDFGRAITLIQFAIKLDILQAARKMYFSDLIRVEVKAGQELESCSECQGKCWRAWGSRLLEFAGAGRFLHHSYGQARLMK